MVTEKRFVGQYEIKETLGKGGYSWVKKGVDQKTGTPVALKFMTRADRSWEKEQAEQVRTEIKSLIRINHKHVMKLFAYNLNCKYPEKTGKDLNTILLVLEFCPGGELFDILYYTNQLDEKTARTYFRQMILGLEACHDNGIIHRDIKPQNLLMDANYQLKITDFGLSFLSDKDQEAMMKTHYVGTRGYQAPELLKKKKYNKKCDVFSCGVVLFILLTGYPPFEQAMKSDKWYQPLANANDSLFWEQHKGCGVSPLCQKLITKMLAYKPNKRISIEDIKKDAWYGKEVHGDAELAKVLHKKHKECVARRKKDKKKMSEMQNSIKKKRAANPEESAKKSLEGAIDLLQCVDISSKAARLSTRFFVETEADNKDKVPKKLVEAYELAKAAMQFDGQSLIKETEDKNPWDLQIVVKDADKNSYQTNLNIVKDKKTGDFVFTFKRIEGNIFRYKKLWIPVEDYLLACDPLTDEFSYTHNAVEAVKDEDDKKEEGTAEEIKESE